MGAIRPNKNFDNERGNHTSYAEILKLQLRDKFEQFKQPDQQVRYRSGNVRHKDSYNKWFKQ